MALSYESLFEVSTRLEEGMNTIPVECSPFEETIAEAIHINDVIDARYLCRRHLWDNTYLVEFAGTLESYELFLVEGDDREVEDFIQKADRVALLAGDRIVSAFDIGNDRRHGPYAVYPHCDGETLSHYLVSHSQWTLENVLDFATAIGEALESMHELGVFQGFNDTNFVRHNEKDGWYLIHEASWARPHWRPRAPECLRGAPQSAASDQWVFAALIYRWVTGEFPEEEPFAPSDLRADVPDHFDRALLKALSRDPKKRWRTLSECIATLRRGVRFWRQPSIVAFDARETSRLLQQVHLDAVQKKEGDDFNRAPSMVARNAVSILSGDPIVNVRFSSIARLRREFRRNLVNGCLFVPMNDPPPPGSDLTIRLELAGSQAPALENVLSTVVNRQEAEPGRPPGCGVLIDASRTDRIYEWLTQLDFFEVNYPPSAVVRRNDHVVHARAGDDAACVLYLIPGEITVMELRTATSGVPVDFDQCLKELVTKELVVIDEDGHINQPGIIPLGEFDNFVDDYDRQVILERIRDAEQASNFLAAKKLTQQARAIFPNDVEFTIQYALQVARFDMRWDRAREIIGLCRKFGNAPAIAEAEMVVSVLEGDVKRLRERWAGLQTR